MSRFKELFHKIRKLGKSHLASAIEDGMICGKDVTVMGNANFGSEPYLITLADHVRISNSVTFITHDGGNWAFRHDEPYLDVHRFGKIVVDEYTFIGAHSTIMPGVHIGKHCVIGIGAVVTKSIPDNSVAVGIPARVVSDTYAYAEKMKSRMPADWNVEEYKKNKKEYLIRYVPNPKQQSEEDNASAKE